MFTVEEVAIYLRVSKVTMYRLAESKKINSKKVGGQLRFSKNDIATYLKCEVSELCIGE